MNNNKGVVLIVVLWVLVILSLIAWGLGRRSSLEVSLLETYQGKLRSYAAARAGINDMLDMLQRTPSTQDSLYAAGIAIDPAKTPEDIFSHIDTGQNTYAISQWLARNYNFSDNNPHLEYGLRDEEGKININAVSIANYQVLSSLLQLYGLSQSDGDKLALAIVNYTGTNAAVSNNNSFMNLNDSLLKPKNKPYENLLELLEVDGMTREIFDKIKDDVTVYGDAQNGLRINTDTANNDVIQAVANYAQRQFQSNPSDIETQAYSSRDVAGQSFTPVSGTGTVNTTDPNWMNVANILQVGIASNYYRARVVGVDGTNGTRTVIEAVIHQVQGAPGKIISWQRD